MKKMKTPDAPNPKLDAISRILIELTKSQGMTDYILDWEIPDLDGKTIRQLTEEGQDDRVIKYLFEKRQQSMLSPPLSDTFQ